MSISNKKQLAQLLPKVIASAAADAQQQAGQEWPCTVIAVDGAIVTVAFEVESEFTLPQVTVPIAESRYVRLPVQEGDQGMVMAASARLGGVTGLGSGLAPTVAPSNLGGLVFVPLGNKAWHTIDPNAVVVEAPNGFKAKTDNGVTEIIADTGQIKLTQGNVTVEIQGGNVTVTAPSGLVKVDAPNAEFTHDVLIDGNLTVGGDVTVAGSISATGNISTAATLNCATMTCTGNAAVGSLTIAGQPYLHHSHGPGTYHIGGNSVVGESDQVTP